MGQATSGSGLSTTPPVNSSTTTPGASDCGAPSPIAMSGLTSIGAWTTTRGSRTASPRASK
eukprot:10107539-Alexandrium_andersonii.AAC.1